MDGEEFVRGYEELYGLEVRKDERVALVNLLNEAPRREVMLFNLFLGMARGHFGIRSRVRASLIGDRFAIYVYTRDREGVEDFRSRLRGDFQCLEARRIEIEATQGGA